MVPGSGGPDIRLVGNLVGYIDYFLVGLPHVYFFVEGGDVCSQTGWGFQVQSINFRLTADETSVYSG